ncbi:hypothetical protein [Actinomadura vinacea]
MEFPSELRWLKYIVGSEWPEGDEDAMRRLARMWRDAAARLRGLHEELNAAAGRVGSTGEGPAFDAFRQYWEQYSTVDPRVIPSLAETCDHLAKVLEDGALDIEAAKYMFYAMLIITAIEVIALIAAAWATFGASMAGIPLVEMTAQLAARTIAQKLLTAILRHAASGALEEAALTALIQGIQVLEGNRKGLDGGEILTAARDGAIGGAISGGLKAGSARVPGLGDAAGDGLAATVGKHAVRDGAGEAIAGVASTAASAGLSGQGVTFEELLMGASSGAVGGGADGAKEGFKLRTPNMSDLGDVRVAGPPPAAPAGAEAGGPGDPGGGDSGRGTAHAGGPPPGAQPIPYGPADVAPGTGGGSDTLAPVSSEPDHALARGGGDLDGGGTGEGNRIAAVLGPGSSDGGGPGAAPPQGGAAGEPNKIAAVLDGGGRGGGSELAATGPAEGGGAGAGGAAPGGAQAGGAPAAGTAGPVPGGAPMGGVAPGGAPVAGGPGVGAPSTGGRGGGRPTPASTNSETGSTGPSSKTDAPSASRDPSGGHDAGTPPRTEESVSQPAASPETGHAQASPLGSDTHGDGVHASDGMPDSGTGRTSSSADQRAGTGDTAPGAADEAGRVASGPADQGGPRPGDRRETEGQEQNGQDAPLTSGVAPAQPLPMTGQAAGPADGRRASVPRTPQAAPGRAADGSRPEQQPRAVARGGAGTPEPALARGGAGEQGAPAPQDPSAAGSPGGADRPETGTPEAWFEQWDAQVEARRAALQDAIASGRKEVRKLGGGENSRVTLFEGGNGVRYVEKTVTNDENRPKLDGDEYGSITAQAIGALAPIVIRKDPHTIYMEYVDGDGGRGLDKSFEAMVDEGYGQTTDGWLLNILDVLTGNPDRNMDNLKVVRPGTSHKGVELGPGINQKKLGRIWGLDFGELFVSGLERMANPRDNPLIRGLVEGIKRDANNKPVDYIWKEKSSLSRRDAESIERRLAGVQQQIFDLPFASREYAKMKARMTAIKENAAGVDSIFVQKAQRLSLRDAPDTLSWRLREYWLVANQVGTEIGAGRLYPEAPLHLRTHAREAPANAGSFTVIADGEPGVVRMGSRRIDDPQDLAALLKHDRNRAPDQDVVLLVPGLGDGPFIEAVAAELGVRVSAPSGDFTIKADGAIDPPGLRTVGVNTHRGTVPAQQNTPQAPPGQQMPPGGPAAGQMRFVQGWQQGQPPPPRPQGPAVDQYGRPMPGGQQFSPLRFQGAPSAPGQHGHQSMPGRPPAQQGMPQRPPRLDETVLGRAYQHLPPEVQRALNDCMAGRGAGRQSGYFELLQTSNPGLWRAFYQDLGGKPSFQLFAERFAQFRQNPHRIPRVAPTPPQVPGQPGGVPPRPPGPARPHTPGQATPSHAQPPHPGPGEGGAGGPLARFGDSPAGDGDLGSVNVGAVVGDPPPEGLPERLHDVWSRSRGTAAGRAYFGQGHEAHHDMAQRVAPDPDRFVLDVHGDRDGLWIRDPEASEGKRRLSIEDAAALIENDPGWEQRPRQVMLLSCETGAGDVARDLSRRLDVAVTAPKDLAWSDVDGNVYSTSGRWTDGRLHPNHPPDSEWTTSQPDGTETPAGSGGYAPGHPRPKTQFTPEDQAGTAVPRPQTDEQPGTDPAGSYGGAQKQDGGSETDQQPSRIEALLAGLVEPPDADVVAPAVGLTPQPSDSAGTDALVSQWALASFASGVLPDRLLFGGAERQYELRGLKIGFESEQALLSAGNGVIPGVRRLRRLWGKMEPGSQEWNLLDQVLTDPNPKQRLQEISRAARLWKDLREITGDDSPTVETVDQHLRHLDRETDHLLPEPERVHWGMHALDFAQLVGLPDDVRLGDWDPRSLVGTSRTTGRHVRGTPYPEPVDGDGVPYGFRLHLDVPAGAQGVRVDGRVVLSRTTRYQITDVVLAGRDANGRPVYDVSATVFPSDISTLPAHLREVWRWSSPVASGRSLREPGDPSSKADESYKRDPNLYALYGHGFPDRMVVGAQDLSPEDVASIIRQDPRWGHRTVFLYSCSTGKGDFAAQVAELVQVPVIAPTDIAWLQRDSPTYATPKRSDEYGLERPLLPPTGDWMAHIPGGRRISVGYEGYAPVGVGRFHERGEWEPPRHDNRAPIRIELDPGARVADLEDLAPNTLYRVVEVRNDREVLRSHAYTGERDADGRAWVTHVELGIESADPARAVADPNDNPDLADPRLYRRIDLGLSEPLFFGPDVPREMPLSAHDAQRVVSYVGEGLALYGPDEEDMQNAAVEVRPDQTLYTVHAHGDDLGVLVNGRPLRPADLAVLVKAAPGWDGRYLRLLVRDSESGVSEQYAAEVARHLGVRVIAPKGRVEVDANRDAQCAAGWRLVAPPRELPTAPARTEVGVHPLDGAGKPRFGPEAGGEASRTDGSAAEPEVGQRTPSPQVRPAPGPVPPGVGDGRPAAPGQVSSDRARPPHPGPGPAGPEAPLARYEDSPAGDGDLGAVDVGAVAGDPPPEGLPERLHDVWSRSRRTAAGRAYYGPGHEAFHDMAQRVPPDPNRFTIDIHGDRDGLWIRDPEKLDEKHRLSVDDARALIENDPDWKQAPRQVMLLSCETGAGDFVQRLSDRLGVPVKAPTQLAWSDRDGQVYSTTGTEENGRLRPDDPPNGAWVTAYPGGTPETTEHGAFVPRPPDIELPPEHRADPDIPHQQADWAPPRLADPQPLRITLEPDERIADHPGLKPNRIYYVYRAGVTGANVLQTIAYTDGVDGEDHGRVTHVTTPPPALSEPTAYGQDQVAGATPLPGGNPDFRTPAPGVVHRIDLGVGEPWLFEGDPEDGGRSASAVGFDPPALPDHRVDGFDVGEGPYSLRPDLPGSSRIRVYDHQGELHGVFWTNEHGEVTHVRTWYGNKANGFNPDLGAEMAEILRHRDRKPPCKNAYYMVEPRERFTGLSSSDLDPPARLRTGDMRLDGPDGQRDLRGVFLYQTGSGGETVAATGQPHFGAGKSQRNRNTQALVGWVGEVEYPDQRVDYPLFNGGHIFAHEGRGPGELINYFPQDEGENQGGGRRRAIYDLTWRAMERHLASRRAHGVRVERFEVFLEPNAPKLTPQVVHARWTQIDEGHDPPEVASHYRSFHNLTEQLRILHGITTSDPQTTPEINLEAQPMARPVGRGENGNLPPGMPEYGAAFEDVLRSFPPDVQQALAVVASGREEASAAETHVRQYLSRLEDGYEASLRLAYLNGGTWSTPDEMRRSLGADPELVQQAERAAQLWHFLSRELGEPTAEALAARIERFDSSADDSSAEPGAEQAEPGASSGRIAALMEGAAPPAHAEGAGLSADSGRADGTFWLHAFSGSLTDPGDGGPEGPEGDAASAGASAPREAGNAAAGAGDSGPGDTNGRGTHEGAEDGRPHDVRDGNGRGSTAHGADDDVASPAGEIDPSEEAWRHSAETAAGRVFSAWGLPSEPYVAQRMQHDPQRFVLDGVGDGDELLVGGRWLNATEVAELILRDPNWAGRDLLLLVNDSGRGRLALEIARQLGARVIAPTGAVELDPSGRPIPAGWIAVDQYGRVDPEPFLPAHLHDVYYQISLRTQAGRVIFMPDETWMDGTRVLDCARAVPPDPDRFYLEVHGFPTRAEVGGRVLSAADVAAVIRHDPEWRARPVFLVSCSTGADPEGGIRPFAAELAELLGVPVTAPDRIVWVTLFGQVFAASMRKRCFRRPVPQWPPDGAWTTFHPNGDRSSGSHDAFAPGHSFPEQPLPLSAGDNGALARSAGDAGDGTAPRNDNSANVSRGNSPQDAGSSQGSGDGRIERAPLGDHAAGREGFASGGQGLRSALPEPHAADPGLPHQQTDWNPPVVDDRIERIDLEPGRRIVDRTDLKAGRVYFGYRQDESGASVLRTIAYTQDTDPARKNDQDAGVSDPGETGVGQDGVRHSGASDGPRGWVTHVITLPSEPDAERPPYPDVVYRIQTVVGAPHLYKGISLYDHGIPPAVHFNPPHLQECAEQYDVFNAEVPYTARTDLPANRKIMVFSKEGTRKKGLPHCIVWTKENGDVTHVYTWHDGRHPNPDLGNEPVRGVKGRTPRPEVQYRIVDRTEFYQRNLNRDPAYEWEFTYKTGINGTVTAAHGLTPAHGPTVGKVKNQEPLSGPYALPVGEAKNQEPLSGYGQQIFPSGPKQAINHFAEEWGLNHGDDGLSDEQSNPTWRAMERHLDELYRRADIKVFNIDFFAEHSDTQVSPPVVHVRWTQIESQNGSLRWSVHFRSFYNLDEDQRFQRGLYVPGMEPGEQPGQASSPDRDSDGDGPGVRRQLEELLARLVAAPAGPGGEAAQGDGRTSAGLAPRMQVLLEKLAVDPELEHFLLGQPVRDFLEDLQFEQSLLRRLTELRAQVLKDKAELEFDDLRILSELDDLSPVQRFVLDSVKADPALDREQRYERYQELLANGRLADQVEAVTNGLWGFEPVFGELRKLLRQPLEEPVSVVLDLGGRRPADGGALGDGDPRRRLGTTRTVTGIVSAVRDEGPSAEGDRLVATEGVWSGGRLFMDGPQIKITGVAEVDADAAGGSGYEYASTQVPTAGHELLRCWPDLLLRLEPGHLDLALGPVERIADRTDLEKNRVYQVYEQGRQAPDNPNVMRAVACTDAAGRVTHIVFPMDESGTGFAFNFADNADLTRPVPGIIYAFKEHRYKGEALAGNGPLSPADFAPGGAVARAASSGTPTEPTEDRDSADGSAPIVPPVAAQDPQAVPDSGPVDGARSVDSASGDVFVSDGQSLRFVLPESHAADPGFPHQLTDWNPPEDVDDRPVRIDLGPDERIVDRKDLEPGRVYLGYRLDDSGASVLRTIAYTQGTDPRRKDDQGAGVSGADVSEPGRGGPRPGGEGAGRRGWVTHVISVPSEADAERPQPHIVYRIETGIGAPHLYKADYSDVRIPRAVDFDPPLGLKPLKRKYDVFSANVPYTARTDLPANSRIAVFNNEKGVSIRKGDLHCIVWTNENGDVTHVYTWQKRRIFNVSLNPDLGPGGPAGDRTPRPEVHYLVDDQQKFSMRAAQGSLQLAINYDKRFAYKTGIGGMTKAATGHFVSPERLIEGDENPWRFSPSGRIFPFGPEEAINRFTEERGLNQADDGLGDEGSSPTWRAMERHLADLARDGIEIVRLDFFAEDSDTQLSPPVVHVRWAQNDPRDKSQELTAHFRSFRNLDYEQRVKLGLYESGQERGEQQDQASSTSPGRDRDSDGDGPGVRQRVEDLLGRLVAAPAEPGGEAAQGDGRTSAGLTPRMQVLLEELGADPQLEQLLLYDERVRDQLMDWRSEQSLLRRLTELRAQVLKDAGELEFDDLLKLSERDGLSPVQRFVLGSVKADPALSREERYKRYQELLANSRFADQVEAVTNGLWGFDSLLDDLRKVLRQPLEEPVSVVLDLARPVWPADGAPPGDRDPRLLLGTTQSVGGIVPAARYEGRSAGGDRTRSGFWLRLEASAGVWSGGKLFTSDPEGEVTGVAEVTADATGESGYELASTQIPTPGHELFRHWPELLLRLGLLYRELTLGPAERIAVRTDLRENQIYQVYQRRGLHVVRAVACTDEVGRVTHIVFPMDESGTGFAFNFADNADLTRPVPGIIYAFKDYRYKGEALADLGPLSPADFAPGGAVARGASSGTPTDPPEDPRPGDRDSTESPTPFEGGGQRGASGANDAEPPMPGKEYRAQFCKRCSKRLSERAFPCEFGSACPYESKSNDGVSRDGRDSDGTGDDGPYGVVPEGTQGADGGASTWYGWYAEPSSGAGSGASGDFGGTPGSGAPESGPRPVAREQCDGGQDGVRPGQGEGHPGEAVTGAEPADGEARPDGAAPRDGANPSGAAEPGEGQSDGQGGTVLASAGSGGSGDEQPGTTEAPDGGVMPFHPLPSGLPAPAGRSGGGRPPAGRRGNAPPEWLDGGARPGLSADTFDGRVQGAGTGGDGAEPGGTFREVPEALHEVARRYAAQPMPESFFSAGTPDTAHHIDRLARSRRAAMRLADLNGGRMPASRRELLRIQQRTDLPRDRRGLVDGMLSAPARSLRGLLDQLWRDHLEWERLRGYLGEEPSAEAFRRHVAALDRALDRPLPEAARGMLEFSDVSSLVAGDGSRLGTRDAVAHLTGTVQTAGAPLVAVPLPGPHGSDEPAAVGRVPGSRLTLALPKGARGLWVDEGGRPKLILAGGTQYQITRVVPAGDARVRLRDGRYCIDAVVVPPGLPS